MLKYKRPDTTITLAEGLREYYASRDDLATGRGISDAAQEFFRCHDAAHVVFGCSTELPDEGVVKMWSFFGTTAGFGLLAAYRLSESQEIYETLGWGLVVSTAVRMLRLVPLTLWRCFRMVKRWPWSQFDQYLDVPLAEIRREYGIQLVA
jgi:ubiquinone biosynthesis protein Coq4